MVPRRLGIAPPTIDNVEDLRREVLGGATEESLVLEFKKDLQGRTSQNKAERDKGRLELCRDIAAFASTLGGVIVIGVSEKQAPGGRSVADKLVGVSEPEEVRKFVLDALAGFMVPPSLEVVVCSIKFENTAAVVVSIPPSRGLARVVTDRETWSVQHLRRTSRGKQYVEPEEALQMALDHGRAAYLALNHAVAKTTDDSRVNVSPLPELPATAPDRPSPSFSLEYAATDEHRFVLTMQQIGMTGIARVALPYSLLEDAWLAVDGKVELMLRVRLIFGDGGECSFEPAS